MTMMETGEVQRMGYAMQAALRNTQRNGHGIYDRSSPFADPQIEQLRYRLVESLGERLAQRVYSAVSELLRARARDVIRERFAGELRAAMLGTQPERGFDFAWIEKRLAERLTSAIAERLSSTIYERASTAIGERVVESVREAASGTPFAYDDRVSWRIREHLEPEITARIAGTLRDRDGLYEQVERALRERFREAFQTTLATQSGAEIEVERVIEMMREKLSSTIGETVAEGLEDKLRDAVRERVVEVARHRLDEALRAAVRPSWERPGGWPGSSWPADPFGAYWPDGFGQTTGPVPSITSPRMTDVLAERLHDAILDHVADAVRDRVCRAVRRDIDHAVRERLAPAIRATLVEQRMLGHHDPEQFVDSVRARLAEAIRTRLADTIRERVYDVTREPLRDAMHGAVMASWQSPPQPFPGGVPGAGNGDARWMPVRPHAG